MASHLLKAGLGALATNGNNNKNNNNNNNGHIPECPNPPLAKYHDPDVCLTKPCRPTLGSKGRNAVYQRLKHGGVGAKFVPDEATVVCPLQDIDLEIPTAHKGFDTTWIVENTSIGNVVISWVVEGVEWSPFEPDLKPMDDPKAILSPGDWVSVPTFESFVYHVREINEDGSAGDVVLQHRVGMVPIGNPNQVYCEDYDADDPTKRKIDVEPVDPVTAEVKEEYRRIPIRRRPSNTIDIGFRNQVGCPLHVYCAKQLVAVPDEGFNCKEEFKFHLGTKPATQDFVEDWASITKYESSFVGHTFVARLANNPTVVVDSYRVDTTKVIDCPRNKQQVIVVQGQAQAVVEPNGIIEPGNNVIADANANANGVAEPANIGIHAGVDLLAAATASAQHSN